MLFQGNESAVMKEDSELSCIETGMYIYMYMYMYMF